MELRNKIQRYFNLTPEEKDEVLVEIIEHYRNEANLAFNGQYNIKHLIDWDLVLFMEQEEFELVQALTDIKQTINEIEEELRNGL
jgi:hypothetical protein